MDIWSSAVSSPHSSRTSWLTGGEAFVLRIREVSPALTRSNGATVSKVSLTWRRKTWGKSEKNYGEIVLSVKEQTERQRRKSAILLQYHFISLPARASQRFHSFLKILQVTASPLDYTWRGVHVRHASKRREKRKKKPSIITHSLRRKVKSGTATVKEKVTLTSRLNRSMTHSRDRCGCVCVFD